MVPSSTFLQDQLLKRSTSLLLSFWLRRNRQEEVRGILSRPNYSREATMSQRVTLVICLICSFAAGLRSQSLNHFVSSNPTPVVFGQKTAPLGQVRLSQS